jgi:hypothetical protein
VGLQTLDAQIVIADCGEIGEGEDDGFYDPLADPSDPLPDFPADLPV